MSVSTTLRNCRSAWQVRQTARVGRAFIVTVSLVGAAVLGAACSSSDGSPSCADLSARIAELETPPASTDQSGASVEALTERSIQRDSLRGEMARQNCK